MQDRFYRLAIVALLLLLAAFLAQPYIARFLFATTEPRTITPRGDLAGVERSTIELFDRVSPAVVQVVSDPRGGGPPLREGTGSGLQSGTGFVWDPAGHIVTNNHVVENARAVAVRFPSGEIVNAEIVGRAPNYDLAVLRVGLGARPPAPVAIGSSHDLKVGQAVYAIGNPFGFDQSLTTGIISALKRRLPTSGGREIADVIQTDAAINPGNSGGPLLDSAGRLIGVNTAIFSPSGVYAGIGFSIPVDVVNRVVPELIRAGRVPTPGIGILAADEALAARLGAQGVIVAQIVPGSPAERAGLRGVDLAAGTIGDVITAANGRPVRRLADLTAQFEQVGVGRTVTLTVERGDGKVSVEVAIADVGRP